MALGGTEQIIFYVFLFGVGSVVSIGVPIGIMVIMAIRDRKKTKKSVPIVLRMFTEDGSYEELIGIPHDLVVQFLESTYNVKIVTNKPKPRPPDKELLKWLRLSMSKGPGAARHRGSRDLNLERKEYTEFYKPKRQQEHVNLSQFLATLEEYRR